MREQIIEALKKHAEGHIEKHKANVEVLLQKTAGIAEHPDTLETIEKELTIIAQYDDELEMLNFRFEELYESQFPERLQAQYKKNMNGGIMAQNTQTGIDGIPDKFDI